jgi:opacity protein-like surface antigen
LPGLDAFARGDIGGFGMGTSSTLAWNVIAGLSWQTTEHLSLVAGYRDFDINAAQGSGTTRFGIHAKMQGPFIAFALQY